MGPIKDNVLKVYGREPRDMDDLAHCIMAVINSQQNFDHFDKPRKNQVLKNYRVVGFSWNLTHHDSVSNSHSSPEGLPQNWGAKEHLPKGYEGWHGRVWIRYEEEPQSWGSGPFEKTLSHTGTGGAGSYDGPWTRIASAHWHRHGHKVPGPSVYSWDYKIFDADWPGVTEMYEKLKVWHQLAGTPVTNTHRFLWNCSKTEAKDAKFMAECALIKAKKEPA